MTGLIKTHGFAGEPKKWLASAPAIDRPSASLDNRLEQLDDHLLVVVIDSCSASKVWLSYCRLSARGVLNRLITRCLYFLCFLFSYYIM